jgi:hypothetical protein
MHSTTKINQLLQSWPSGTVGLPVWLEGRGISSPLQQYYRTSGWLESVGQGAFRRAGDTVDWLGGLYALQTQEQIDIHCGARTALGILGQAHYLELNAKAVHLFSPQKASLPAWFRKYDWKVKAELHRTDFLPPNLGLVDVEHKLFTVKASGSARALMECLYLAPKHFDIVEAYQVMEGLTNLRPTTVQTLLEVCQSVKVKRLFLFLAEKCGHAWFKHLELEKVDLGKGKRSLVPGGHFIPKYQITVPKELLTL